LTAISLPSCTTIGSYAFSGCKNLSSVNLSACTLISSNAFANCYNLSTLILGASTCCSLTSSIAFQSTPYAGYKSYFSGTPYIYVPQSLMASYKASYSWRYFSSYFSAIEDSGGNSGDSGSVNIITFTIDGDEYQAEENMTWLDWCYSEYNIMDYTVVGNNSISCDTGITYVCDGLNYVSSNYIIESKSYTTRFSGGAAGGGGGAD
jgi:hypothetical protein